MGALNIRSRDFPIVLFEAADVTAMNTLTGMRAYDQCILDNGNKYEYRGSTAGWSKIGSSVGINAVVVDVGNITQRHNRFIDSITATYPGDDTFSVAWAQAEDVRRYRILVTGGADGDYVKVAEDAPNHVVEANWLADPTSSRTADVEHFRVYTSTPDANGSFIPLWSEWKELSKDPNDDSLSRLGFLGSAAVSFTIFVEAE